MSYIKNTWSDGDVITAVKINNIEDGIAANDANISQLQSSSLSDRMVKGEGALSIVEGNISGDNANIANGACSHAEGFKTHAGGSNSHAEGADTQATGSMSHAEGASAQAIGFVSHAEGNGTEASGTNSHAEGGSTKASGDQSHAEGGGTEASGINSHAEGGSTKTTGMASHAEGISTIANGRSEHVFGEYNVASNPTNVNTRSDYVEIVGNGENSTARSNARTLDWSGNESLSGSITLGMGTANEVTLTPEILKQLIALLPSTQ